MVEGMGKRKFTAEQAREALLATGVEMLESIGPAGVATVSLAEAINRSGVPRPSAYRVFGGGELDPQGAFQEELVLRVIANEPGMEMPILVKAIAPMIEQANSSEREPTAEELTELFLEVVKASAETIIAHMISDPQSGVHLSAMALVRTSAGSPRIEEAIAMHRESVASMYQSYYRDMMSAFGLRLRAGWTDKDLFTVFHDATMGAVLASKSSSDDVPQTKAASWLAATYVALTALATEPDARRVVSAQPLTLLSVTPKELLATA